jgi:hypothetical protein
VAFVVKGEGVVAVIDCSLYRTAGLSPICFNRELRPSRKD